MPKDDDITVQIFDGHDYNMWKKRILLFLKLKKCYEPAIREKSNSESQAEWDEKNLLAMNYIYSRITNKQLELVDEEETALKIFKKFEHIYSTELIGLTENCIKENLKKMKMNEYEDSKTFFKKFENLLSELKSTGAEVNEREKLDYMLKTFPDSLSCINDLIDSIKESDRNFEFFKNKIEMWESRGQGEIFKVKKKDIKCFRCGKNGHLKKDCRNMFRGGADGEAQGSGSAHQPQEQQQSQQYKGFGKRGRDRGGQSRNDGQETESSLTQLESENYDKARSEATFRYTVNNFSKMEGSQLSPPFYVRNLPWKIMVEPRTSQTQQRQAQKSLGFFLQCNGESQSDSWSCYAIAELSLLHHEEWNRPFTRKSQHLYCSMENDWGYSHFMTWEDVLQVERGYIKDDTVMFEVRVVVDEPHGVS